MAGVAFVLLCDGYNALEINFGAKASARTTLKQGASVLEDGSACSYGPSQPLAEYTYPRTARGIEVDGDAPQASPCLFLARCWEADALGSLSVPMVRSLLPHPPIDASTYYSSRLAHLGCARPIRSSRFSRVRANGLLRTADAGRHS